MEMYRKLLQNMMVPILPCSKRKRVAEMSKRFTEQNYFKMYLTDSPRPITLDALGHRGLLVVYVLYVLHLYPTLPSGPPCSEQQGHRLQARHKIRCL